MKTLLFISLLAASAASSYAQADASPSPVRSTVPAEGTYGYGMQQRSQGDYAAAKQTFFKLLLDNPAGAGALEGLGLSCIALGQYEEAAVYLGQWNSQSPGKPYVMGLLMRAQNGAGDGKGALTTARELAKLDPHDCAARQRADSYSERDGYAVFPQARTSRSVSIEDLASGNPQRIVYEGASAGARFRAPLRGGLDLIGGAELRTEAQRNDGRGFTYFELQEQLYSAGLSGRFGGRGKWEAEYGQSAFSDISTVGGSQLVMGRGRLSFNRGASGLELASQPKIVRVTSGGRFYRLLRENSARAESEASLLGFGWYGRAGASNISGDGTLGRLYARGLRDLGWSALNVSYSHSQQEFYSAAPSGRLRYVQYDRFGAALSRGSQGAYRASASAYQTYYADSNKLFETGAELTAWLPWQKEFSGGYRFSNLDFRRPKSGYDTVDETGHWLGAYWKRCAGYNWSAAAAYEHGFISDSLLSYGADLYTAELEWYADKGSFKLQGRHKDTAGRGHSWSAGLQARYNF